MAVISGMFLSLELSDLQTMKTDWTACLKSIATANQSYSIAGRSFTRANLAEVSQTLAEIGYAIAAKTPGARTRTVYADMSH